MGLLYYYVDKKEIYNVHQKYIGGSLTYLEKDLNDGDTEIYLNDVSGFIRSNISGDYKGIIVWNYNDSTGME